VQSPTLAMLKFTGAVPTRRLVSGVPAAMWTASVYDTQCTTP
jgi:hypothetical protein